MIKSNKIQNRKIVVAMSGGIDSSVCAALLKKAGFQVQGVFMKLSPNYSELAQKRARQIANFLKIPFQVLDLRKEFKKKVIDYFIKAYKENQTPNPCVICNKEIKFGLFLENVLTNVLSKKNALMSTGHYVRIEKSGSKYKMLRAKDKKKDQSYFLWTLKQNQLKHILFPLGDYTKKQVKQLGRKFKIPFLDNPESQEICFIKTCLEDFLKKHIKNKKGNIVDTNGKIIGEHQGLHFYTIGQRKGIRINKGPWYVIDKNMKSNILIVSQKQKGLMKKELIAKDTNWISGKEPKLPIKIKGQIRYQHQAISATISRHKIVFDKSQKAITPGQSIVFYKRNQLLGGGIINENH
ncbi:MAG: tRNA 2-thiouridine(34) synthase MnmA [Candidatus Pacebacteria bacterium]|nr:tRNA 2-thiouridine(34) synthase MnmA [Candidatus Paceibacterota bacterium]